VRLEDLAERRPLSAVGLALTQAEAQELLDSLKILLRDPSERHEHVSSDDYQTEITVWIDRSPAKA
jgi:hypothetical protein